MMTSRMMNGRLTNRRLGGTSTGRIYLRRFAELATTVALLMGCTEFSRAQNAQGLPQGPAHGWGQISTSQNQRSYPGEIGDPAMEEKRLNALNAERQKAMVADTDKLVKLAAELNQEVNGKSLEQLTDDQLRKVAEIEKLAHSIREKMSTSVKPAPMMDSPTVPLMQ